MSRIKAMEKLFDAFLSSLQAELDSGEVSSQTLSVIRQFLKDNGIEALPEENEEIQTLVDSIPTFTESDDDGGPTMMRVN